MQLGVCYYPEQWPETIWERDAQEMKALGLSIVRIGEFSWSRMEPKEGQFSFGWLDKAIDIMGKAGLKVILGTPTATPPRWVLDKFPDMLAYDKEGRPRKFGSRRHYCFSHEGYRAYAAAISGKLAKRYGANSYVYAWQTDNEYGCHDTTRSYGPTAEKAFRKWLKNKYADIAVLNERWGTVFWSMAYADFDDIELPNLTVTEANPAQVLDYYRFSSDQVIVWNKAQVAAIRKHSEQPIMHNYMGRITDFDHYKVGDDLDFVTWDSYPLGFLEDRSDRSEAFRHDHQYCGDPDFQAFHHDLYRATGRGRWAVMEQQPGPVNWAPYNPAPAVGMVRLWTLEAMAHGAEFVAYFRWRQAPFAQEQMHSALKRADDVPSKSYAEIKALAEELSTMPGPIHKASKVGIIFDYESQWAWEVQPQGKDFDYFKLVYAYYCALRCYGVQVDILRPDLKDLSRYNLIVVPGLFSISEKLSANLTSFKGELLMGPRTNSKTEDFSLHLETVADLFGEDLKLVQVETLRPSEQRIFPGVGTFKIWIEELEKDGQGVGPILRQENKTYVAGWPEEKTMMKIVSEALGRAGVPHELLPEHHKRSGKLVIDYRSGKAVW